MLARMRAFGLVAAMVLMLILIPSILLGYAQDKPITVALPSVPEPNQVTTPLQSAPLLDYQSLFSVAITGPTSGYTRTINTFTGIVTGITCEPYYDPCIYTWSPAPDSGQGTDYSQYQWTWPGTYTITLQVEKDGSIATDTHKIVILPQTPNPSPMPKGFTYDGPRGLPASGTFQGQEVMLDEEDEKITMGDYVHLQLPFTNRTGQMVSNAAVLFDGVSTNHLYYPDVWIARSDDLDTWNRQTSYSFGPVANGDTVFADIWIYIDRYIPYDQRKSIRGAAILRLDYGQDYKEYIGITLEPIRFSIEGEQTFTRGDCLHHPYDYGIVHYAQYVAARPIGPQASRATDPDTPEQVVRNVVSSTYEFTEDGGTWGQYRVSDTTLLTAKDSGIGVCRHYADLTIGLLRSLGIPTRHISAKFFKLDRFLEMDLPVVGHDWTEVNIDGGWRQADSYWKVAFDEGVYQRKGYTLIGVWADQYPLAASSDVRCAPSCYQPPVNCDLCLKEIDSYKTFYRFGCTESVLSRYQDADLLNQDRTRAFALDGYIQASIQSPILVTRTVPFTIVASLANSTTQNLEVLTATLSYSEDISSTLPYDFFPTYQEFFNLLPGESVTSTWVVTPLITGSDLSLAIFAFSDDSFAFDDAPLVVNEPGTPLPLKLGGLCGLSTVQPGQPITLTAYVLDETLELLTDTLTSVNATIYVTPTLDYSTTVPLNLHADGFFRRSLILPTDAPVGTYLVEYVATRSGYDAVESIASFHVSPPLSVTLVASSDSLDIDKPITLTVGAVDRTMTITEASVWAAISTPGGVITTPLLYGSGVYTTTFRPVDLAPDLGGTISGGQWQITVTADYYGSTAAASETIFVWSRVYLPLVVRDY